MISQELIDGAIEQSSKRLSSIIRSHGGHIEHRFSKFWKAGLARSLFLLRICVKDIAVNFVFK